MGNRLTLGITIVTDVCYHYGGYMCDDDKTAIKKNA